MRAGHNQPPSAAIAAGVNDAAAVGRGWLLGVLGAVIFALTIPMTRLASGSLAEPQLPAVFVAIGRAALAGLLALVWLVAHRAAWPSSAQWPRLALTACGVVLGFPLFMGLAVQRVDAVHASVVTGLLPIATAAALTLPVAWLTWPDMPVRPQAWAGFAYVAVFSMWLGFFAWYRGLALGGTLRISQMQLLQPFLSMWFAVPLPGESLDAATIGFSLAVMATVFVSRRLAVAAPGRA